MKKTTFLLSLLIILMACNKTGDKKSQLENLKKERDKLNEKISQLEKEMVAGGDSSMYLYKMVEVKVAEPSEFNHYIEIQGKVDGDENIAVTAQMGGIVQKILIKEGQAVKTGQLLAELDASVLNKNLAQMQSQLTFVNDVYEKQKALWEQKIGSEIQYLTAKNNKESLENSINTLKEQVEMSKLKSPISGAVEELSLKIGQMAAPGYPLLRVVNLSSLKVVAEVSEAYASKINEGDGVIINFPDISKEVEARVDFSSKYINPVNRTFMVESRLKQGNSIYRANMIAILRINDYKNKAAFILPVNVIQNVNNKQYIYVAVTENNNTTARRREVTTGISYNGMTEILTGITSGDKVVTTGAQDLNDGQLINY